MSIKLIVATVGGEKKKMKVSETFFKRNQYFYSGLIKLIKSDDKDL